MADLTSLQKAQQFQVEAAKTGFEWDHIGQLFEKLSEESQELQQAISNQDPENTEEELGDLLFVIANIAKNLNLDAETALEKANKKFSRRYEGMFKLFEKQYPEKTSRDLTLAQWDELWAMQKQIEKSK